MSWQIFLTISVLTFSLGVILQKHIFSSKKIDAIAFSVLSQILIGTFTGLYAFFTKGIHLPNISPFFINILLMIFLYVAMNVSYFTSLKIIDASEFTILLTSRVFWTIFAAVIFLHEKFSFGKVMGTVLILASVVLVSYKKKKLKFSKGELLALIAAACLGLAFVNDDYMVKSIDPPTYISFAFFLPGIVTGFVFFRSLKNIPLLLKPPIFLKICILDLLYSISTLAIYFSYLRGNNAAQIGALNQTSTIIIVLLSIAVLGETGGFIRKIIGSITAFLGVLLLR